MANLRVQVNAFQPQTWATTKLRIWQYLKGRGEDIFWYVERFYINLEQADRRLTMLAWLHGETQYKSDDESGNMEEVAAEVTEGMEVELNPFPSS